MSAYVRVCPRKNFSQADISGLSRTFVDSVRECPRRTVRRGHSRTFADYFLRTFADCCRGLFPRTFADIRGHSPTFLRGLWRGHFWTFPWTFADFSVDIRGLFPRTVADFFRGHSRTFSADIRGLFPRTSADFFRGHSRTFFPRTFADIDKFFLLTFEYIRILFGHLPNVSK